MNTQPDLGRYGATIVTGVVAQSGTVWCAIMAFSATIFATISDASLSVSGSLASATLPAGAIIFGAFTDWQLTSGSVIAYKARASSS